MVAIPSLVAYRLLRSKVDGIVIAMEKDAMRLADALEKSPAVEAPPRGRSAVGA